MGRYTRRRVRGRRQRDADVSPRRPVEPLAPLNPLLAVQQTVGNAAAGGLLRASRPRPEIVLGRQQALGNWAVQRQLVPTPVDRPESACYPIPPRADLAHPTAHRLVQRIDKSEKRRERLAGKMSGPTDEQSLDLLVRSFADFAGDPDLIFVRCAEAILNLRATHSADDIKTLYKTKVERFKQTYVPGDMFEELALILNPLTGDLVADIGKHTGNVAVQHAIEDVLDNGRLAPFYELKLALGLLTHAETLFKWSVVKPGDMKRAIQLLEGTNWSAVDRDVIADSPSIKAAFGQKSPYLRRFKAWAKVQTATKTAEEATTSGGASEKADAKRKLQKAQIAVLTARVRHLIDRRYGLDVKRAVSRASDIAEIAAVVKDWMKTVDHDTCVAAADQSSDFYRKVIDNRLLGTRHALRQQDRRFLLDLLQGTGLAAPEVFVAEAKAKTGALNLTDEEKEEQFAAIEEREEEGKTKATAYELKLMIEREKEKAKGRSKTLMDHKRLIDLAYALDDKERDEFVKQHYPPRKDGEKLDLDLLTEHLQQAKFKQHHIELMKARFSIQGELGANYRKVKKLLVTFKKRRGLTPELDQELDLVSRLNKLSGDEFRQIREDPNLLPDLFAQVSPGIRRTIEAILGIAPGASAKLGGQTVEERSQEAQVAAETSPAHWAALINHAIVTHLIPVIGRAPLVNIQKLYGVVQRAQHELGAKSPKVLDALALFSPDRVTMLRKSYPVLHDALASNKPITITQRLKVAHRRGVTTRTSEIYQILEETPDDQIVEWSNYTGLKKLFEEKKRLQTQRDEATKALKSTAKIDSELEGVRAKIDAFNLDIDPAAHKLIYKELHSLFGKQTRLAKAEQAIRSRIAVALARNGPFRDLVLGDTSLTEADRQLLGERMQLLSAIGLEEVSKKGNQWRWFSVLSVERRIQFAQLRSAHKAIKHEHEKPEQGGHLFEQGEVSDPVKKQAREKTAATYMPFIEEKRQAYSQVQEEFEKSRAKWNDRVLKTVELLVAAVLAGMTAGMSSPITFVGAMLISMISSAVATGNKILFAGIRAAVEGGADVTLAELIRTVVATVGEATVDALLAAAAHPVKEAIMIGDKSLQDLITVGSWQGVGVEHSRAVALGKGLQGLIIGTVKDGVMNVAGTAADMVFQERGRPAPSATEVLSYLEGAVYSTLKTIAFTMAHTELLLPNTGDTAAGGESWGKAEPKFADATKEVDWHAIWMQSELTTELVNVPLNKVHDLVFGGGDEVGPPSEPPAKDDHPYLGARKVLSLANYRLGQAIVLAKDALGAEADNLDDPTTEAKLKDEYKRSLKTIKFNRWLGTWLKDGQGTHKADQIKVWCATAEISVDLTKDLIATLKAATEESKQATQAPPVQMEGRKEHRKHRRKHKKREKKQPDLVLLPVT